MPTEGALITEALHDALNVAKIESFHEAPTSKRSEFGVVGRPSSGMAGFSLTVISRDAAGQRETVLRGCGPICLRMTTISDIRVSEWRK